MIRRLLTLIPWCHRHALTDAQRQIDNLSARCDLLLGCVQSQRETISGLSLQLCRRDGKAEHETATIESLRLQLQACRRHNDTLLQEKRDDAQRIIELEAQVADKVLYQLRGLPIRISEN